MDATWIEVASKNGLAIVVLVALAAFVYNKIWPLFEKRLADADIERKENLHRWEEQGKLFAASLQFEREDNAKRFEEQGKLFAESMRRQNVLTAETHKEITQELRAIKEHLRNGNGK